MNLEIGMRKVELEKERIQILDYYLYRHLKKISYHESTKR